MQGTAHLIVAQARGQLVDLFLGIADKSVRKLKALYRVGRDHLHSDQPFGGVIADLHAITVNPKGLFVGCTLLKPLNRIDIRVREMRLEPVVSVQSQHCFAGCQIGLDRDTILLGRHGRALKQCRQPLRAAALRLRLLDDNFRVGGIHRGCDIVEIPPHKKGGQTHEE